jgi:hypothetical protein
MVLDTNFGGGFYLFIASAQGGRKSGGSHCAGDPDLALATNFSTGN